MTQQHTSYPYLRVAQRNAAPYGLVLAYADYLDRTVRCRGNNAAALDTATATELRAINILSISVAAEIMRVHDTELARQRAVTQLSVDQ